MKRYLAIDIGASSGRHIVGWKEEGLSCSSWRFMDTMSFLEYLLRYEWNKGRSITDTLINEKACYESAKKLPIENLLDRTSEYRYTGLG